MKEDPRFRSAGRETTVKASLPVIADLREGVYSVGIRLPDQSPSLCDGTRVNAVSGMIIFFAGGWLRARLSWRWQRLNYGLKIYAGSPDTTALRQ